MTLDEARELVRSLLPDTEMTMTDQQAINMAETIGELLGSDVVRDDGEPDYMTITRAVSA